MRKMIECIPKGVGTALGIGSGFGSSLGPIKLTVAAAVPKATLLPLLWGAIIGMMIFTAPTVIIQHRINERFDVQHNPITNRCCHFLLYAAFITLSTLVGFAITCTFVSIIANPFTLPALIASGISAGIMLGLYAITYPTKTHRTLTQQNFSAVIHIEETREPLLIGNLTQCV